MANVASKDSNVVDPFINANNVVEINTVPEDKYAGTYFFFDSVDSVAIARPVTLERKDWA